MAARIHGRSKTIRKWPYNKIEVTGSSLSVFFQKLVPAAPHYLCYAIPRFRPTLLLPIPDNPRRGLNYRAH